MPVQRKTLKVLPNPWTHIDEKGRPAGAVIVEQPSNGTFDRRWVGASFTAKDVQAAKRVSIAGRTFEQSPAIHEHEWDHASDPVSVANTQYYRKCVFRGDLIAADEATAMACGIAKKDFVQPETLFQKIKSEAIAEFDARNGEGAFDALAEMRDEDEERAAEVARAVAEATAAPPSAVDATPTENNVPKRSGAIPAFDTSSIADELDKPSIETGSRKGYDQ